MTIERATAIVWKHDLRKRLFLRGAGVIDGLAEGVLICPLPVEWRDVHVRIPWEPWETGVATDTTAVELVTRSHSRQTTQDAETRL